jgi:flagellar biosynthetic protein FliQ
MTATMAVDLMRQAMMLGLTLALPPLLAVLIVGLVIGILQAATGIQEFTLTFVPKVLTVLAIALLLGALGLSLATEFMAKMLSLIPQIAAGVR